ncbi:MAG: hypothetical protein PHE67_04615 [Campylobacterales bacterium]|nr:hypothetical protein [Campylobacterales bacterium]
MEKRLRSYVVKVARFAIFLYMVSNSQVNKRKRSEIFTSKKELFFYGAVTLSPFIFPALAILLQAKNSLFFVFGFLGSLIVGFILASLGGRLYAEILASDEQEQTNIITDGAK